MKKIYIINDRLSIVSTLLQDFSYLSDISECVWMNERGKLYDKAQFEIMLENAKSDRVDYDREDSEMLASLSQIDTNESIILLDLVLSSDEIERVQRIAPIDYIALIAREIIETIIADKPDTKFILTSSMINAQRHYQEMIYPLVPKNVGYGDIDFLVDLSVGGKKNFLKEIFPDLK